MPSQIDYTEEWTRLGYENDLGSCSFLPPPAPDFVRAYHMTCVTHALSDIEQRRLKVARFSEANDPFELLGLNCHVKAVRRLTKRFIEKQDRLKGLLSFSENWTNPVLWSHYGAKHHGICLGFDLLRSRVEKVKYADKRLREKLPDDKDPDYIPSDIRDQLARTKSRDWQYEQELRVLVNLSDASRQGNLYFWPFSQDLRLAEVILGPRCDRRLGDVRSLVARSTSEAVSFKARLAFRSFRVVLDGRTRPNPSKAA